MRESEYFWLGAVGTAIVFLIVVIHANDCKHLKREAIKRGYALHCPHDGEFAWVGECEQDAKGEE